MFGARSAELMRMMKRLWEMLSDDSGATLVEYTLVLTLIAVVSIVVLQLFGANTGSLINSAASSI